MYRSILVPLDGSTSAEHALPLAMSLTRKASAALTLATVQVPMPPLYDAGTVRQQNPLEAEAQQQAQAYLNSVAQRMYGISLVPATLAFLQGSVADALHQHARTRGIDLVVMTVIGAGPWTRLWLGSVADELVRRLPMPVLLVRPEGPPDLRRESTIRRILVPLDGSAEAEHIVEPAVALGTLMQAEYTLLRVVKPAAPRESTTGESSRQLQGVQERLQTEAQVYLYGVAERLRAKSLQVQTRVVFHDHPATAILDAQVDDIDLIAFTTRGHKVLPWLFLGSTADKVLRGATVPVLVQRPPDESVSDQITS